MTAPVSPTPQAPAAPETFASAEDGMAAITATAVAETLAANPEPVDEAPIRDERGRFVPREAKPGDTAEQTADDTVQAAVAETMGQPIAPEGPEPVELPEGFVAVPRVEGRELATPFVVKDAEGELEVPDLQITYTANGKERTDPLDKVVKLAQMGVYNEGREQQVQAAKQSVLQSDARVQQVETLARQLLAEREQLLSNDEAYLMARAQYEAQNTPEARLAAQQQQLVQQQQHMEFTQASREGDQFFQSELAPAVDMILQALPTIGPEEIAAKLLLVSNGFEVHTPFGKIIPPRSYAAVRQAIAQEVVPWAQQLHAHRESERQSSTTKTDAEKLALQKAADAARAESQRSKNLIGRTARPGAQGRPGSTAPPAKPIKTVQDAEDAAISDTLIAMGMQRVG